MIGWEAEMQKVDEECERRVLLPKINPAVEAQKARELAAARKAAELTTRKERLQRLCSWSGLSRCALSLDRLVFAHFTPSQSRCGSAQNLKCTCPKQSSKQQ